MRNPTFVIAMLLMLVLAAGCGDYEIPLKHGYFIARISAGTFVVVAPNHRIVAGPTLDAYAVQGDVLAGHVSSPESYFVLNMRTGELTAGPSEEQWNARLAAAHIQRSMMKRPTRFQPVTR